MNDIRDVGAYQSIGKFGGHRSIMDQARVKPGRHGPLPGGDIKVVEKKILGRKNTFLDGSTQSSQATRNQAARWIQLNHPARTGGIVQRILLSITEDMNLELIDHGCLAVQPDFTGDPQRGCNEQ